MLGTPDDLLVMVIHQGSVQGMSDTDRGQPACPPLEVCCSRGEDWPTRTIALGHKPSWISGATPCLSVEAGLLHPTSRHPEASSGFPW